MRGVVAARPGPRDRFLAPVLLALAALLQAPAAGAACPPASHADAGPAAVEPLPASFCRMGEGTGTATTLFRWTLSAAEARHLWSFRLEALPGQVARLELFAPGAEEVARAADLGGIAPAFAASTAPVAGDLATGPLLLVPGTYLVAVRAAGRPVTWRLSARATGPLPGPRPATPLQDAFRLVLPADGEPHALQWTLSEMGARRRWRLDVRLPPGIAAPVELLDAAGGKIADVGVPAPDGGAVLADLGLAAGTYRLAIGAHAGPALVRAVDDGARSPGFAEEPNGERPHALAPGETIRGRLSADGAAGDLDRFRFDVDGKLAARLIAVSFGSAADGPVVLQLDDAAGRHLATVRGSRSVDLPAVRLRPGRYEVTVAGALGGDAAYWLHLADHRPLPPGIAGEPDGLPDWATPLVAGGRLRGRLSPEGGADHVALEVGDRHGSALWTIELLGRRASRLVLADAEGRTLVETSRQPGTSVMRLTRLLLHPGRYRLVIAGETGPWFLHTRLLGQPLPGGEVEPNDGPATAQPLALGAIRNGWLDHAGDADVYAFALAAGQRVRIQLSAPPGFPVQVEIVRPDGPGAVARLQTADGRDGMQTLNREESLPAGAYLLRLTSLTGAASLDSYDVRVEPVADVDRSATAEQSDGMP